MNGQARLSARRAGFEMGDYGTQVENCSAHAISLKLSDIPDATEVCERCANIDLDRIFRTPTPSKGSVYIMYLGSHADLESSGCQLCRLFASMAPKEPEGYQECHLFASSANTTFSGYGNRWWGESNPQDTALLLLSPHDRYPSAGAVQMVGFLGLASPNNKHPCRIRIIDPETFPISVARDWLSYCMKKHRYCDRHETSSRLQHFHVFDCRLRKVVDWPMGCRYVALSYVWAKHTAGMSSQYHSRSEAFEKVIEDAITISQALGFRYLWVDKVCIDQSDHNDKLHQIKQMDLIYTNSALTIIAAAGDGPAYGLPGVNGTRRRSQPRIRLGAHVLASTSPAGRYELEKSKWRSRGWTLQESALATRRLIFTESQVLYECDSMNCRETWDIPLDVLHVQDHVGFRFEDRPARTSALGWSGKAVGHLAEQFWVLIDEFASRELSYPSDRFNAFRGILSAFKNNEPPLYSFWGVPLSCTYTDWTEDKQIDKHPRSTIFMCQLLWSSKSDAPDPRLFRARRGMPSWSWTDWDGRIQYIGEQYLPDCECFADTRVWLEDNTNNLVCLDDISADILRGSMEDIYSSVLEVEGWIVDASIALQESDVYNDLELSPLLAQFGEEPYVPFLLYAYHTSWTKNIDGHFVALVPSRTPSSNPSNSSNSSNWSISYFYALLLEDVGGHFERVGVLTVTAAQTIKYEATRRRIRLG